MRRIIKPSRGAYAVFGMIMCFPVLLTLTISVCEGHIPNHHLMIEDVKVLGVMAAVILPIVWIMSRIRIVVTGTEMIVHQAFVRPVTVPFSDIASSMPQVFARRSHPGRLIVIFKDESKQPVTLFLAKFPSADVAWLLSLEQLKVKRWPIAKQFVGDNAD